MNCSSKLYFAFLLLLISILPSVTFYSQEYDKPFYEEGIYDENIPKPEDIIGTAIGERPFRYWETVNYLTALANSTPLAKIYESGKTHQGRKLYYLVITSQENWNKLEEIKNNISLLADPRKINSENQAQNIIEISPAVAWMMYSIHGNEVSGTDAGIQLAYQLIAGQDETTKFLRKELIIGIDPMENPDGRERFLSQLEQWSGVIPNSDVQSMPHSGLWPSGRTNHYHFDLNRDWFILSQPESFARVKLIKEWKPQLVIDAHEMGSYNTYLFNPPREPINQNMDKRIQNWWKVFASDQAKAFDKYGWSYYTKDWLEEWYPGYGSAYPTYHGAISILYEQAGTQGSLVKRPEGETLTFRESVHHQFISSIANLKTAAENRKPLLRDFYEVKKDAVSREEDSKAFIIDPTNNPTRAKLLIEKLLLHGIEVEISKENFTTDKVKDYWENKIKNNSFSKGTYIINFSQPMRPLINAILEFDPRMTTKFLQSERESLEKGEGTRLYEVSAWSMLLAYGLDAYISLTLPNVNTEAVKNLPNIKGEVFNSHPAYGYIIKYNDDSAIDVLLKLFDLGYKVRTAQKPFTIEGRSFDRGSLLIRLHENNGLNTNDLTDIVLSSGINIYGANTALSQEGPDLGTSKFVLLTVPKIAMLTGSSINMGSFGTLWYLLDNELKLRFSIINYNNFVRVDLRKYNVLILPSAWGGVESYKNIFDKNEIEKLKDWISDGGTLIGIGGAAAFLTDTSTGISKVKLRRQALKELDKYADAFQKEQSIKDILVDSISIWEGNNISTETSTETKKDEEKFKILTELDEEYRAFYPRGVIMRLDLNEEHWLNFGAGKSVPAIYYSSYAYLSKSPVQTAARFSEAKNLRLSGLLWPETKTRWENSSYATRESNGKGQIILFAGEPNFRSYFYGTARLFINSILLGPGLGTQQAVEW